MAYSDGSTVWPTNGGQAAVDIGKTYGPRDAGNQSGPVKTEGAYNEIVVNFDADGGAPATLLAGSEVVEVDATFATGAVTVATVGGVDVSLATEAAPVGASGEVVITGPTAGSVILRYKRIAQ